MRRLNQKNDVCLNYGSAPFCSIAALLKGLHIIPYYRRFTHFVSSKIERELGIILTIKNQLI